MKKLICGFLAVMMLVGLLAAGAVSASAASTLTTSEKAIKLLKEFEGFAKYAYRDNGQYSIGYGTSCDPADYPNYLRIGAKYNGLTADHDAYLVLPKITYPAPQNLGKDKPFVAQTVGAETPASWSYTFTEAGTYKVCVVGTIITLAGEKSVVTEATITVTE